MNVTEIEKERKYNKYYIVVNSFFVKPERKIKSAYIYFRNEPVKKKRRIYNIKPSFFILHPCKIFLTFELVFSFNESKMKIILIEKSYKEKKIERAKHKTRNWNNVCVCVCAADRPTITG